MSRKAGNPNWGKPDTVPFVPSITEFDKKVAELQLQPDQYARSAELRDWVAKNKNSRYVPEPLLQAWGFEVSGGF